MDSKNPAQLDPKLKEAYDRVMGTVVPPRPAAQQETPPPPPPAAHQPVATPTPQTPPTLIPQTKAEFAKKKKGISPLIIVLGIIVLLVVYTFVWIKIFNVQLF